MFEGSEEWDKRVSKLAKSGQSGKFACKNAYQRKQIHLLAEKYNLIHRTIVDYTMIPQIIQTKFTLYHDSKCCGDCNTYHCQLTMIPISFVEVNSENEKKIIIGNVDVYTIQSNKTRDVAIMRGKVKEFHSLKVRERGYE